MSSHRRMRHRQGMLWLLVKRVMQGLFRLLFRLRRRRTAEAGFVFPTTVLLVLMVTLTAGALTYRAYSRSSQVAVERQQQVIVNAGTPAVDRSKAKLEYLMNRDGRPAPKVPPSNALDNLLRAVTPNMLTGEAYDRLAIQALDDDIYTLEDEERIDLDGDNILDNAWVFNADVNGDGEVADSEVVVYSILVDHQNGNIGFSNTEAEKAGALVARNSPLTAEASDPCVRGEEGDLEEEPISGEGWSRVSALKAEKTFQVDVFATDLDDRNIENTVSTLEFQQIRDASLGNKWGAWFRYDLEATPGPEFNWNGAMHTQGSLFMANNFNAYMISSTASCAYDPEASELTLGALNADTGFQGQLVSGNADAGLMNRDATIHVDDAGDPENPDVRGLDRNTDSVDNGATVGDIYLDPIQLQLNDVSQHVNADSWNRDKDPRDEFPDRVRNIGEDEPFDISLDDTYRADDRYGPKKVYDDNAGGQIPAGTNIGTDIAANPRLTNENIGLDGFWERQAVQTGTRFIVGQRLELGNVNGWSYSPVSGAIAENSDPLYPPDALPDDDRRGERYQRKSLRDNLAAVQGMVVYHYETPGGGRTPAVCIATTAHHGTYQTVANSRTFRERIDNGDVMLDFLTGNGTNGWEFDPVDRGDINIQTALNNLANFAGDPLGGAPSFTPEQDGNVHPFPYMAMWGDFSTLRRVQVEGEGNASIADDSTLDTAACTLALLAYNIDAVYGEYTEAVTNGFGGEAFADLGTALTAAYAVNPDLAEQSVTAWKAALGDAADPDDELEQQLLLDIGWHYWGVERDRQLGFNTSGLPDAVGAFTGTYDAAAHEYDLSGGDLATYTAADGPYTTYCDPEALNAEYGGSLSEDDALSLAIAMCQGPHYPALYYIFPTAAHDSSGGGTQPATEDYIAQTVTNYGENNNFAVVNYAAIAAAYSPHTADGFDLPNPAAESEDAFDIEWGDANTPDDRPWDLVVTDPIGGTPDGFGVSILDKVVYSGRENMAIRLLDLHVGELMTNNNVAASWFTGQDVDGNERFGLTYAFREDAVREDNIVRPTDGNFATCGNYATYATYAGGNCYLQTAESVLDWKDPPLSTDHLISLKPVDYVPDPMRKPYGFRLREGADFGRPDTVVSGLTFISDSAVAIQGDFNLHTETAPTLEEEFTTPKVFEQDPNTGDQAGGIFYNAFYGRTADNANDVFAAPADDKWRATEVLGDAVYLFSNDFKDGFVEAGYASDAAGDPGGDTGVFQFENNDGIGEVSFQNMNRPANNAEEVPTAEELLREDPNAPRNANNNAPESSVYFDRNGVAYFEDGSELEPTYSYIEFDDAISQGYRRNNLPPASPTTINALIISGIVPSRPGQIYGGLHNFPRFNEYWEDTELQIAGGFFQLAFSHSSTGPYDMEAWEFDDVPAAGSLNIGHFWPPDRVWGYDVALQYAQQPPISSRFVSVGTPRSELYKELPIDDEYIKLLRCARRGSGDRIDDGADCN
ncbi:MAG: hypothetical protein F6J95_028725 [Leptolyngbya sp. SIO1E4]|nr:hypothetical protein [Leptolyngbya sp. SIO1E4]